MHEIAIADKILRESMAAGARKFVRIEVGELCEITKEELEMGLKQLNLPDIVESYNSFGRVVLQRSCEVDFDGQIDFVVDFIESKIKCECGFIGRAIVTDRGHGYCLWECPKCGASGVKVEVLKGGEIKVVEVG